MTRSQAHVVLAAAIVASLVLSLVGPDGIRLLASLNVAVVLPGVCVVYAVGLDRGRDPVTTAVLVLGSGISIGVLTALVAALLPTGLNPVTGRVLPVLVSLFALGASWLSAGGGPVDVRADGAAAGRAVLARAHELARSTDLRAGRLQAAVVAIAIVVVVGAVALSDGGRSQTGPALSIVPDGGKVVVTVDAADAGGHYQVELVSGDDSRLVDLVVDVGQRWAHAFDLPDTGHPVRATLRGIDRGTPVLTVWLDPSVAPLDEGRPAAVPADAAPSPASG